MAVAALNTRDCQPAKDATHEDQPHASILTRGAKMLMLVNRETGRGLGVTLFDSEEAMRRGDAALNAMNPGASERRTSVEFYEVPVQTVAD